MKIIKDNTLLSFSQVMKIFTVESSSQIYTKKPPTWGHQIDGDSKRAEEWSIEPLQNGFDRNCYEVHSMNGIMARFEVGRSNK